MDLGENIKIDFKGDKAIITIDLKHRGGTSVSGKTIRIASSMGNHSIKPGIILGLNCYTKNGS